ncbi:lipase family protein [Pararhizobium sp. YC-54]|uniref:lipase family protein n=1 Tax=Pararhizobium sp. YC-54 TaxID=2986920 RepID=UPI0021F73DD6|nr:lipase family protein [Pararhizobium sp. YC-54]MCV9998647.1 lipase family protein [Pararhizobium sp. YC-54]
MRRNLAVVFQQSDLVLGNSPLGGIFMINSLRMKSPAPTWSARIFASLMFSVSLVAVHGAQAQSLDPNVKDGPQGSIFWDDVPQDVPADAKRGDIYWVQQRQDAPEGSKGWNMIYVTEGADGALTYVSGEIYLPNQESSGPRPLVLWNHETAGTQDSCAPSRRSLVSAYGPRIPALKELLDRGYAVVGSDYQGLGTPGATAYLNGLAQAHASLDAARVALKFPGANADRHFTTYGWSQGGQTSLWVAHIQETYAPELDLLGVGAIAPASRHWDLTEYDLTTTITGGYYISRMAGLNAGHPELKLRDVLSVDGLEMLEKMSAGCWDIAAAAGGHPTTLFANQEGLQPGKPWRVLLEENDKFLPVKNVPFVFFQGDKDDAVPETLTHKVAVDICGQSTSVDYRKSAGLDHENIVPVAAAALPEWFAERFEGKASANNCSALK